MLLETISTDVKYKQLTNCVAASDYVANHHRYTTLDYHEKHSNLIPSRKQTREAQKIRPEGT